MVKQPLFAMLLQKRKIRFHSHVLPLLFLWFFVQGCSYVSVQDHVVGEWAYNSVSGLTGSSDWVLSPNDVLKMDSNGQFSYDIISQGIHASGTWSLKDESVLVFEYQNPDTVRYFKIRVVTRNYLEFTENDAVFTFLKSRDS